MCLQCLHLTNVFIASSPVIRVIRFLIKTYKKASNYTLLIFFFVVSFHLFTLLLKEAKYYILHYLAVTYELMNFEARYSWYL